MALKSYRTYSRLVSVFSGIIVIIAVLNVGRIISIFPEYVSIILIVCGLLAPAISQELRVDRERELVKEDMLDLSADDDIKIIINVDGDDILEKLKEDETFTEEVAEDNDGGIG